MYVEISDKLFNDICSYCELNGIKVGELVEDLLRKAFTIEKYGERPVIKPNKPPKQEEKVVTVFDDGTPAETINVSEKVLVSHVEEVDEVETNEAIITSENSVEVNQEVAEEQPKKRLKRKLS